MSRIHLEIGSMLKSMGLSFARLRKRLGKEPPTEITISKIANNKIKYLNLQVTEKICTQLGLSLAEVISEQEPVTLPDLSDPRFYRAWRQRKIKACIEAIKRFLLIAEAKKGSKDLRDVCREMGKIEEDLEALLYEPHIKGTVNSYSRLSQRDLAKRFHCHNSTVSLQTSRGKESFYQWSQGKDPEGIAWELEYPNADTTNYVLRYVYRPLVKDIEQ